PFLKCRHINILILLCIMYHNWCGAHLVLLSFPTRRSSDLLDGHTDDRLGELHRLEDDGVVLVAESVAGGGILQAHDRRDVACVADRKSTRLNSSHVSTSYAVFCLKQKIDNRYQSRSHERSN